jgi:predicted nucleic acid-binding protein
LTQILYILFAVIFKRVYDPCKNIYKWRKPGSSAPKKISFYIQRSLCAAGQSRHIEQNKRTIESFIIPLVILPFDANAAKQYGYILYKLEQSGRMIGSMEMHIAAIVVANDARIVTNNLKELNRVSGLKTK